MTGSEAQLSTINSGTPSMDRVKGESAPPPRVVIEGVSPEVDAGRFPAKRIVGDTVAVEADVFADGHDQLACRVLYRHEHEREWHSAAMRPLGNDRWRGEFQPLALGRYHYTVEGWIDPFSSWRSSLVRRIAAQQDVRMEWIIGADLLQAAAGRAEGEDAERLQRGALQLRDQATVSTGVTAIADDLAERAGRYVDRASVARYDRELVVVVDRDRARYSTWYEVFPRSCASEPGRHGTFKDCEAWLPYIADMGFDVLYLPPIHPIGRSMRKGRNNAVAAAPGDVGSPWAIGAAEGGHKATHPDLGSIKDFRALVTAARTFDIDVALDLAYQCSADHPYLQEHPEWFRKRPDGTIQYAENPPKKYQDIYPFDFECAAWRELWEELKSVVQFWIDQGVRVFRVDNPHTKALAFWEWLIEAVKASHPDVIFLAEAFTRPRPMYRLAKLGFSQSYTYFTWRNTAAELTEFLTELTQTDVREFFRPNLWPNTPDILHEYLQEGGRPAFLVRSVLAGTLAASYGIYGPAFELCEHEPRDPGGEEYLDSEKYELRHRQLGSADSLRGFLARLNRIRRDNPALHRNDSLRFHASDNPQLLCYSKANDDLSNVIVTVVNLDVVNRQWGWVTLDLEALGLEVDETYHVIDLLGGERYLWRGARNYVALTPGVMPAHVLRLERATQLEADVEADA